MTAPIRERAEAMLEASREDSRVSLTDLGRSNAWRRKLSSKGVLQLMDRSDTAAFVVSVDAMNDLLDSLDEYESQLETASVRDMFEARKHRTDIKSGNGLRDAAAASFDARIDGLLDIAGSKATQ
jgi:5'-deoxynucleotidase YfbR-like HD superfamily hydrolase